MGSRRNRGASPPPRCRATSANSILGKWGVLRRGSRRNWGASPAVEPPASNSITGKWGVLRTLRTPTLRTSDVKYQPQRFRTTNIFGSATSSALSAVIYRGSCSVKSRLGFGSGSDSARVRCQLDTLPNAEIEPRAKTNGSMKLRGSHSSILGCQLVSGGLRGAGCSRGLRDFSGPDFQFVKKCTRRTIAFEALEKVADILFLAIR